MNNKLLVVEAFSSAWSAYKRHWGFLIAVLFIFLGVSGLMMLVESLIDNAGASLVLTVFRVLLSLVLQIGLIRLMIQVVDGEALHYKTLFSTVNLLGKALVLVFIISLLAGLALMVGGVLVGIGAFFLSDMARTATMALGGVLGLVLAAYVVLRFYFVLYLLADKEAKISECLKTSGQMVSGNYLSLIALIILSALVNILGFIVFVVGFFLVSIPVTALAQAYAYRQLYPKTGETVSVEATPSPFSTDTDSVSVEGEQERREEVVMSGGPDQENRI